jgi:MoxR-like ATPase
MSNNSQLPQCWQDFNDVLQAGIDRVILFGPPGTGKTFAGLNSGTDDDSGAWRLVCTEDMTNFDVTGGFLPDREGSFKWHDGSAIKAWRGNGITGGRLVVDEIDKAGGDVFATLLAMTDTVESAKWENPATGRIEIPREGFSVIMTTNIENMEELPSALKDRFPCAIRINEPHPDALLDLPTNIREYARKMADAGDRRISLRQFYAYGQLKSSWGDQRAAELIFGERAESFLDAVAIDTIDGTQIRE